MFNIISVNLLNVLLSAGFFVVVIVSGAFLIKWLWIDKTGGFVFPRGKYKLLKDNTDKITARSLEELLAYMWEVLSQLDADYWMEHIGIEGAVG